MNDQMSHLAISFVYRDFLDDKRVYILDMYNREIYPRDGPAKKAISRAVELRSGTGDQEYLRLLEMNLKAAFSEFEPDLVVYNAGTDVLQGDPLGRLDVTEEGVVARDEMVFQHARSRSIPIMMVTSGGYQRSNARVIADSVANLAAKGLISLKAGKVAGKL
ncbi:Predicted histone deacetylase [Klebsormidium nitens]|uniref:Predicted histone deacetylase n=1 Tax=Klebsormidium nitens TaxID=105231 RepID=A0A1Y1HKQ9_KLENI|nr:Predicted histone deacetylase [Klebsormidium nitens]|eukprot:GAQ78543.1 Predicted histone deacetylase [Klebsormidium nitens]